MEASGHRQRARTDRDRPEPDEVDLASEASGPLLVRAGRRFLADNGTMLASALAYASFFALPSILLVGVGVFSLVAGPGTVASLMEHFRTVMPAQATSLLGDSLQRLAARPSTGVTMTAVGFVLALWSTTGAMTSFMTALNIAWSCEDHRSFVRKRLVSLAMVGAIASAFLLVAVLLMFGPQVERLVASHAGGASGAVPWLWWIAQWPILVGGLLVAFSTLLTLGPAVERRRRLLSPGSLFAVAVWLAVSGAFAVYTGTFGSYNKTWGSLAAVIVLLTWLWLAAVALLLGAEIDAEAERPRPDGRGD